MLRLVVIVWAVVVGAHAQSTQVASCTGSSGELPISTYIEGCETAPCVLHQEQDMVMHVFFRASRPLDSMRTLATAYFNLIGIDLPVPYELGERAHTCNYLNNQLCPVSEGEFLHYTLRLPVESFMPVGTSMPIEFRVVEEATYEPIFCVRVPVFIAPPLSSA